MTETTIAHCAQEVRVDEAADTFTRIVTASPADVPYLLAKIEKANRKAARAGVKGYDVAIGEVQQERGVDEKTGLPWVMDFVEVTVTGEAPKVAGWSFVATLSWDVEVGLITRVVPGLDNEPDLSGLRAEGTTAWCDHCGTARFRLDTFAVRNVETGEIKQVGRNCLQSFLGIDVNLWLPQPDDLGGDDERGGWMGRGERRTETEYVLAAALAIADLDGGFVSRSQARAYNEQVDY